MWLAKHKNQNDYHTQRGCTCGNYMELNSFYKNMNWKMQVHIENSEKSYREICEVYNEGISTWVLIVGRRETEPQKRYIWINKRYQKAKEDRNVV